MTKFDKKAFIKAATKVEEIMSTPSSHQASKDRLTFEQTKEIDEFLEGYNRNPSNSNKWRYALHAHINELLAKQADSLKQSLVAEMPKKIDVEIQPNPSDDEYIEWGIRNNVLAQVDQAITKVFNGRM
jgi:hypothetical protein